jgi:hypothetical protein
MNAFPPHTTTIGTRFFLNFRLGSREGRIDFYHGIPIRSTEMLLRCLVSSRLIPWLIVPYIFRAYLTLCFERKVFQLVMRSSETRTEFTCNVASWTIRFDSLATSGVPFKVNRAIFVFEYVREQCVHRERVWVSWKIAEERRKLRRTSEQRYGK